MEIKGNLIESEIITPPAPKGVASPVPTSSRSPSFQFPVPSSQFLVPISQIPKMVYGGLGVEHWEIATKIAAALISD